jgi:hypothetical protein
MAAGLCSFIGFGLLEYWFVKTAPHAPYQGATHAIKWPAMTIYLTDAQQLETDTLFWGACCCCSQRSQPTCGSSCIQIRTLANSKQANVQVDLT